jgi:hypothetical protein
MPGRQPASYFWARHLEVTPVALEDLSPAAREGFEYALELAEDAYQRSRDPRRGFQLEPLTLERLAIEYDLPAAVIARRITLARRQLFGNLSDAAIYRRLQRQRGRKQRACAQAGCTTTIPITRSAHAQYCQEHASGKERTRRHRQGHRTAS